MCDIFGVKLSWFKENEKPEVVLLIADDPQKIKILIAWTNTRIHQAKNIAELKAGHENEIWQWLWKNVEFDSEELRSKSEESNLGFEKQLQFLIGNRLIYPDGTMHSFVQRYLREKVLKLFDSKPPKSTKKKTG